MKKLLKIMYLLLAVLMCLSTFVYANTITKTFKVVDEKKCVIEFGENGYFEKKIVSYDDNSVTLQLNIKNNSNNINEKITSEIFFVIDNSLSLRDRVTSTETRKDLLYSSAKTLASKLHEADHDCKMGVISFSSCSDYTKEGTIADATLKQSLTSNNNLVLNAIEDINNDEFGSRTNIEAGLELANQNFSDSSNKKFIILLTDGVPNDDIHGHTLEYSEAVLTNTKNKLIELSEKGYNIITVMSGLNNAIEPTVNRTYINLAKDVFGTSEKPTAGKYYLISDENIKTIVEDTVYNDIELIPRNSLTNIVVKDYFPQEIIDNFNFFYVSTPLKGNVSANIDKTTNCITWTIEELNPGEEASFQYKLTLKDNYNEEIANKILPTNEKVTITDNQGDDKISTDSPKVRFTVTDIGIPVSLEEPDNPNEPEETEKPVPEKPDVPDTTDKPTTEETKTPETPDKPTPEETEAQKTPDKATTESSEEKISEKPEKSETPNTSEKENTPTPHKIDTADNTVIPARKLPQTGTFSIIIIFVIVISIAFAVFQYSKYHKYNLK